jgi:murein DD-endopeptidase MepM/ murein hydrolase activator NlpD
MQIKIIASANMAQAESQFAALTKQVQELNAEMAKTAAIPAGGTAKGFRQVQAAGQAADSAYSAALASSGAFRVQQLKINDAVDKNTELLQKQKLSFAQVFGPKNQNLMKAMYKEQLAMQHAVVKTNEGMVGDGSSRMTLAVPSDAMKSWDSLNQRVGWFAVRLKSASGALIDWGKNTQWAGRQLTAGLSMPIVAFGAAAATMTYQVDQQLTRVAKVYNTTANQNSASIKEQEAAEKELAQVRSDTMNTAMKAASAYGASVKDTIGVAADLAATGAKGNALQTATTAVVRNATLGEIDYNTATQTTIALMQQLHHSGAQLNDDWNYMNAVENATSLSMADFAKAIPIALGPIQQMGGSLQDLGTLLTGMVSRGVQIGKAANSIKSAVSRLLNPSKAAIELFKQLTGADITQIATKNKGNLMGMLNDIYNVTKNLSQLSRGRVFAKLFGTYQLTTISDMVASMGDLQKGIGQVSQAYKVGNQSATENAKIADQEIKRQNESISGQFRILTQKLKGELAEMGQPFLEVATRMLKFFNVGLKAFNALPNWGKKTIAFGAILAALVGPITMLIGLSANFAGTLTRFYATILKAASGFSLINKNQWLSEASAKMAAKGFMSEADAVASMQNRFDALTLALKEYSEQMNLVAKVAIPETLGGTVAPVAETAVSTAAVAGDEANVGALTQAHRANAQAIQYESLMLAKLAKAQQMVNDAQGEAEGQLRYAQQYGTLEELIAANQKYEQELIRIAALEDNVVAAQERAEAASRLAIKTSQALAAAREKAAAAGTDVFSPITTSASNPTVAGDSAEEEATAGISRNMKVAAASGGLFAASMATSMISSNKVVDNISKWAMIGSVIVPALSSMYSWITKSAIAMELLSGPLGIAAGIVTAVGVGLAVWVHHEDEILKRQQAIVDAQNKAQNALATTAERMNASLGSAEKHYDNMLKLASSASGPSGVSKDTIQKTYESYSLNPNAAQKEDLSAFRTSTGLIPTDEMLNKLKVMYVDLQVTGDNADTARDKIAGFLQALGKDGASALAMANDIKDSLGGIKNMNWSKAISAQAKNMQSAIDQASNLSYAKNISVSSAGVAVDAQGVIKDYQSELDKLQPSFKHMGQMFTQALNAAMNPEDAKKVVDAYVKVAQSQFVSALAAMRRDPALNKMLEDQGIQTVSQLANAVNSNKFTEQMFDKASGGNMQKMQQYESIFTQLENAGAYSRTAFEAAGKAAGNLGTGITSDTILMQRLAKSGKTIDLSQAIKQTKDLYINLVGGAGTTTGKNPWFEGISSGVDDSMKSVAGLNKELSNIPTDKLNKFSAEVYQLAGSQGIKVVYGNVAQTFYNLQHGIKADTDAVSNLNNQIQGMKDKTVNIKVNASDVSDALKGAMTSIQDEIATNADDKFTKQMNASIAAYQNTWTKREDAQKRAQDAQTSAFTARWDRRKKAMDDYYTKQEANVDKEMKAEKANDALRQKLFDAEQTRLQRLADAQNNTIDFNVALQTGDLDEAAKLKNDQDAQVAQNALADAAKAESKAEKQREAQLQHQKTQLEKEKKNRDAAFSREEADAKKHLERMQEQENQALKERETAAVNSFKAEWNARKKSLDEQLDLFKSYIPKSKSELATWMNQVSSQYSEFGKYTLEPKGKEWAEFFNKNFTTEIMKAGASIASDNNWAKWSKEEADSMLQGFGFHGMKEFKNFVSTGKLPADFGKNKTNGNGGNPYGTNKTPYGGAGPAGTGDVVSRHTGGWVDNSMGSRKGVAKNAPTQANEVVTRLKHGEFVVNEHAAQANAPLLENMNSGKTFGTDGPFAKYGVGGYSGGGDAGPAALLSAAFASLVAQGVGQAFYNAYQDTQQSTMSTNFGSAVAGKYGNMEFSAEQLKNAKIIANVGKNLGMSARDIEIGIMTAIDESGLRNLNYGDRDSVGLFQQRPSAGWGSVAEIENPTYAATKFFDALKGVKDRDSLSPWMAAQDVQRSAYSDGSNYERFWADAQAIYKGLSKATKGANSTSYVPGPGGRHRPIAARWPIVQGIHDSYTGFPAIDIGAPVGQPIYAVANGHITRSYDIKGYEPRRVGPQDGYRSYGRVMELKTDMGPTVLYAHLSERGLGAGQQVKGGAVIAKSGNTGNTTGPHLHFGSQGASPYAWLKVGGHTLSDGLAMLHEGETVLTKPLSQDLKSVVSLLGSTSRSFNTNAVNNSTRNLATNVENHYNVNVNVADTNADENDIANAVIKALKSEQARQPTKRNNR